MNACQIIGRMTREADLRHTGSGIAVATFTVAVERSFSNGQGERETDFINVVAWRKTAEVVANFTSKGSLVGVTGRLQTRNYTNNEGKKVYITELVCENFQMLEPKSVTEKRKAETGYQSHQSKPATSTSKDSDYTKQSTDPFKNTDDSIDITDDDLPF